LSTGSNDSGASRASSQSDRTSSTPNRDQAPLNAEQASSNRVPSSDSGNAASRSGPVGARYGNRLPYGVPGRRVGRKMKRPTAPVPVVASSRSPWPPLHTEPAAQVRRCRVGTSATQWPGTDAAQHGHPRLINPANTGPCSTALPNNQALTNAPLRMEGLPASSTQCPHHIENASQRLTNKGCQKDTHALHWTPRSQTARYPPLVVHSESLGDRFRVRAGSPAHPSLSPPVLSAGESAGDRATSPRLAGNLAVGARPAGSDPRAPLIRRFVQTSPEVCSRLPLARLRPS
jgi:hypothetical protein